MPIVHVGTNATVSDGGVGEQRQCRCAGGIDGCRDRTKEEATTINCIGVVDNGTGLVVNAVDEYEGYSYG
jgi:hypothetical protein